MTTRSPADYIAHMREAVSQSLSYVEGYGKEDFLVDKRTQQAVILNLIVIGEVATKLANEHPHYVAGHAHIPWTNMRGMRNRIAHGYFDINLDIVWQTVQTALPALLKQLRDLPKA